MAMNDEYIFIFVVVLIQCVCLIVYRGQVRGEFRKVARYEKHCYEDYHPLRK